MAGLEPARACYGPTDFKSVASAISPHRQYHSESTSEVISFLARISFVQGSVQERPRSSGLTPINDIKTSTVGYQFAICSFSLAKRANLKVAFPGASAEP